MTSRDWEDESSRRRKRLAKRCQMLTDTLKASRPRRPSCLHTFIFAILILFGLSVVNKSPSFSFAIKRGISKIREITFQKPSVSTDVILSSYMRSGSTIVGKLLGFRNDTFYFYEPLWARHKWAYLRGKNQVCSYVQSNCSVVSEEESEYNRNFINAMYDCDFLNYSSNFDIKLHGTFSGPKWEGYHLCRLDEQLGARECMSRLVKVCQDSKHRFSKMLRITLDHLIPILQQRPNLKVVHLWRDPRGILNSHWRSKWYPMFQSGIGPIADDAKALCKRMAYDIKIGKTMLVGFPGRFRYIQYEEFGNVTERTRLLSRFVDMEYNAEIGKAAELLASSSKSQMSKIKSATIPKFTFNPDHWRSSFPWEYIQAIDEQCKAVYEALGYKRFDKHEDCLNMDVSSSVVPQPFTLDDMKTVAD